MVLEKVNHGVAAPADATAPPHRTQEAAVAERRVNFGNSAFARGVCVCVSVCVCLCVCVSARYVQGDRRVSFVSLPHIYMGACAHGTARRSSRSL